MSVRVCVGVMVMMMLLFLTEMCVTTWISPLQDKKKCTLPYNSLGKNNHFKFNIKYLWSISNQTQSILTFNFKNCYDGIEFSNKQLPYDNIYHPRRGCVLCDQASVQQTSVKQLSIHFLIIIFSYIRNRADVTQIDACLLWMTHFL